MNSRSIDEVLNKAFFLASFILGDRETAIRTVEEATARLDVTTAAQGKRLYYKPSASLWMGKKETKRFRNKVQFNEVHLLQRLIYIASEPAEKIKEDSLVENAAAEEQMLIHFIKHLVRITTRRNSFYVTLAINRLLYNYTTAETMETYNAVIQDPARVKDDYYYRSRKGVLMQELKKRFGSFLDVARGPRGEERFQASGQQGRFTDLVRDCLTFFTPWDTYCLVPAGVNPIIDGIADLSSRSKQDENKIEVDRIHAVLHPDCYTRLIKLLGFDPPDRRLEVPHFFLSKDNNNSGGEGSDRRGRNPQGLSDNELSEIKGHLDDQSTKRKHVTAGMLRILVDGKEQARLGLSLSGSTRFELDEDAELIEVRSNINGDDLLLASHLFAHHESANYRTPDVTSIVLEGGQKVAITVTPTDDDSKAIVDVSYRETALLRTASHYLKRLTPTSLSGGRPDAAGWNPSRVSAVALGIAILLLSAVGIVRFVLNRNSGFSQPETATTNRQVNKPSEGTKSPGAINGDTTSGVVEAPANAGVDKGANKNLASGKTEQSTKEETARTAESASQQGNLSQPQKRETVARNPGSDGGSSSTGRFSQGSDATRSTSTGPIVVPLAQVRKIYVEVIGAETLKAVVREKMIARLGESNRFSVTSSKNDADALLRITVANANSANAKVSVRVVLINAGGEAIWKGTTSRGNYLGSPESVAIDIVRGLFDATAQ